MDDSVRSEVGRIAPVEGLRGVAVLWVILFHCFVLRPDDPWMRLAAASPLAPFVRNGYLGVDLFFLISGFLLAMPWFVHEERHRPPPSIAGFYARRFWRIAPAYYVQIVFLFVVVLPMLRGADYWRYDLWVYLYNFFAHALFLHNTTPLSSGSMAVNGALWTLSVEAQFYLLLPLTMPLIVRWPRTALLASLAVAAWWRVASQLGLDGLVRAELAMGHIWNWPEASVRYLLLHQLPGYLAHFALGIVLGRAWLRGRDRARSAWPFDLMGAAGLFLLYWTLAIDGSLLGGWSWVLPVIALAAMLSWSASRPGALTSSILGRGPLAWVGRISYSAYLYHLPLLILANEFLVGTPAWLLIPLYLAATLSVAWISWRYVEQPFLRRYAREREPTARAVTMANT